MIHGLRGGALAALVVVLLAGLACGRYGPPRRIEAPAATAPPAAAPTVAPTVAPDADPAVAQPSDPDRDPEP